MVMVCKIIVECAMIVVEIGGPYENSEGGMIREWVLNALAPSSSHGSRRGVCGRSELGCTYRGRSFQ